MPLQPRKDTVSMGVNKPLAMKVLFIKPFFAKKVRIICAVTIKGINKGNRYRKPSVLDKVRKGDNVMIPAMVIDKTASIATHINTIRMVKIMSFE